MHQGWQAAMKCSWSAPDKRIQLDFNTFRGYLVVLVMESMKEGSMARRNSSTQAANQAPSQQPARTCFAVCLIKCLHSTHPSSVLSQSSGCPAQSRRRSTAGFGGWGSGGEDSTQSAACCQAALHSKHQKLHSKAAHPHLHNIAVVQAGQQGGLPVERRQLRVCCREESRTALARSAQSA